MWRHLFFSFIIDSSEEFKVMYGKNMGKDGMLMSVGGLNLFTDVYNIKIYYAL